jgi:hypothetical protein
MTRPKRVGVETGNSAKQTISATLRWAYQSPWIGNFVKGFEYNFLF